MWRDVEEDVEDVEGGGGDGKWVVDGCGWWMGVGVGVVGVGVGVGVGVDVDVGVDVGAGVGGWGGCQAWLYVRRTSDARPTHVRRTSDTFLI